MADKDGTQFIFDSVLYKAVRLKEDIELKDAIAEFNIFEDLNKPYLTGSILIGDDTGLMDDVQIKGDETITLIIAKNPKLGIAEPYFRLDFKVVSIMRQEKTADRAEVISLNLISDFAYNNNVLKLSKSYTGKLEEISKGILRNFLNVEVSMDKKYFGSDFSEQEPIRLIIPYLSPLETVEWMTERATDRWGTPFFVWASIWGQDMSETTTLRLGNFMAMVEGGIIESEKRAGQNGQGDYIYSQVQTNLKAPEGFQGAKRIIKNIKFANIENTLKMIREGAISSTISNLDTYTSQDISKLFSITELLRSLNGGGEGDETGKILGTVYDQKDQLRLGDLTKPTDYWSARQRSTVTSYGTYATVNSIHDAIDPSSLLNKVRPLSIRSSLARNKLEIEVDGIGILEDELSVGDIIKVRFLTEDTSSKTLTGSNEERSGYYLIQNCRHIFNRERHDAVLMICKIAQSGIVNDTSMDRT